MDRRARLLGLWLPLAVAGVLGVWLVAEQLPGAPAETRLRVLLVTSSQELPRWSPIWKQGGPHDAQGYLELLSAANIPFDTMWMERFEIPLRYLVEHGLRKYSTIVLATPARNLNDRSVEALLVASKRYGISLLTAGDGLDARLRRAFGIKALRPDAAPPRRLQTLAGARVNRDTQGQAVEVVSRFGRAVNYYFAAGGRGFLDGYGPAQAEVREAIAANSGYGVVSAGLAGAAVLRMDDPLFNGSSFQQDPRWPEGLFDRLDEAAWDAIGAVLARHGARMSLGVVTGYLDDGDEARGTLYRRGEVVRGRRCGQVYDSRDMRYLDRRGPRPGHRYDYESEYRGVVKGIQAGVLDAEVHGFAHVSPDRAGWCAAPDRYTNLEWLMELAPPRGQPTTAETQRWILEEGTRRLAGWFGRAPTSVIPPAHGFNEQTELQARDAGFRLLDAVFLSILTPERVIQNGKVRTFWAHWPEDGLTDAPLRAGYPFVVGLHDRELVERGVAWFDRFLARWRAVGVQRFLTLRELAAHLTTRLDGSLAGDVLTVVVERPGGSIAGASGSEPGEVPVTLRVRPPAGRRVVAVRLDGQPWPVAPRDGREVEVVVPPPDGGTRRTLALTLAAEARDGA
ncbi:MAG TPA: hypothetical protein VGX21_21735 [Methylomirabilota bacterium]|nr:hypothetical protein [Methylomirabilota bacterium]